MRPQLITALSEGRGYGAAGGEGLFSSCKFSRSLTHRCAVPPLPQAGEGCWGPEHFPRLLWRHLSTSFHKFGNVFPTRSSGPHRLVQGEEQGRVAIREHQIASILGDAALF